MFHILQTLLLEISKSSISDNCPRMVGTFPILELMSMVCVIKMNTTIIVLINNFLTISWKFYNTAEQSLICSNDNEFLLCMMRVQF